MDPLSAISIVTSITGVCLKTTRALNNLRSRYQGAALTIAAICSECTMVSASLSQVQHFLQNSHFEDQPEMRIAFDQALTGCMVVFACLENEIERISLPKSSQSKLAWRSKAKFMWNEDTMKEYLSQIRAQQAALSFLVQLLQMRSIDEIHRQVHSNVPFLKRQATVVRSLRKSNPRINVRESILASKEDTESILGDLEDGVQKEKDHSVSVGRMSYIPLLKETRPDSSTPPQTTSIATKWRGVLLGKPSPELPLEPLQPVPAIPEFGSEGTFFSKLKHRAWSKRAKYVRKAPQQKAFSSSPSKREGLSDPRLQKWTFFSAHSLRIFGIVVIALSIIIHFCFASSLRNDKSPMKLQLTSHEARHQASKTATIIPQTSARQTVALPLSSPSDIPLNIEPKIIQYTRPFDKATFQNLHLQNPNSFPINFRVRVTSTAKFGSRPTTGHIKAGSSVSLQLWRWPILGEAADLPSKDKFLIQWTRVISAGEVDWESVDSSKIQGQKIRIEFVG